MKQSEILRKLRMTRKDNVCVTLSGQGASTTILVRKTELDGFQRKVARRVETMDG